MMPDREKVIRGLECCIEGKEGCRPCPYSDHDMFEESPDFCQVVMLKDVLELLREQEPAKPITQDAWPNPVKVCGNCKGYITYTAGRPRYCPNCGGEMKWDD